MAIRYFVCGQCGSVVEKIVDSGNPLICCGREMKERIPGMSEGAGEKHVPVYTVEGNRVHVEVGEIWHPMQEDHFIRFIALEGTKKNQTVHLNPGDDPVADFVLSEEESVQAVYAYCNLHSIWKKEEKKMENKKYVCTVCGYEYDPEVGDPDNGIAPGPPFENLPEDWVCPLCGLGKDAFEEVK